jgi:hypothetical protein
VQYLGKTDETSFRGFKAEFSPWSFIGFSNKKTYWRLLSPFYLRIYLLLGFIEPAEGHCKELVYLQNKWP